MKLIIVSEISGWQMMRANQNKKTCRDEENDEKSVIWFCDTVESSDCFDRWGFESLVYYPDLGSVRLIPLFKIKNDNAGETFSDSVYFK